MKIVLTRWNCLALAALSFFMQESHEIAHTVTGRIICGCWGKRDFNVWGICKGCSDETRLSVLATLAGPAYTFGLIWLGFFLMAKSSLKAKSWGIALVVSSMPFSRVLSPLLGMGDEMLAMRYLGMDRSVAWPIAVLVVFVLAVPPLVRLYRLIDNRRKPLWMLGLVFVPFFMIGAVVFAFLQGTLLRNGILAEYWILGSPTIVTIWMFVTIALVAIFGRHASTLLQPTSASPEVR